MAMRLTKVGFCALLAFITPPTIAQNRIDSCRTLDKQIWYTEVPTPTLSGVTLTSDCDVVRALSGEPNPTVTIRCPSGPTVAYSGLTDNKELTSTDLGHSWQEEFLPKPIPYSATLPDRFLLQAPSSPKILYSRLRDVGLYLRSDDAGQAWSLPEFKVEGEPREHFFSHLGANKFYTTEFHLLAINPREPKHLYARIVLQPWASMIWINGSLANIEVPGVYDSTDGGEDWQEFPGAPISTTTLGMSSTKPGLLYASAKDGILKSEDGGKHWTAVGENDLLIKQPLTEWDKYPEASRQASHFRFNFEISQLVLDPRDSQVVFIVSNKGFYRTMDGGKTWCFLDLGFDELNSATSLAINPGRPAEIFLGTSHGVFYSKDRGGSFEKVFPRR